MDKKNAPRPALAILLLAILVSPDIILSAVAQGKDIGASKFKDHVDMSMQLNSCRNAYDCRLTECAAPACIEGICIPFKT
ncbi:hypothetical protein BVRB_6g154430 [Beta vulgaris subsp. vulgaris]|nr:hypothetical protein BVRB_6g154430 [Beta vulgaris subsp. vulgaris]